MAATRLLHVLTLQVVSMDDAGVSQVQFRRLENSPFVLALTTEELGTAASDLDLTGPVVAAPVVAATVSVAAAEFAATLHSAAAVADTSTSGWLDRLNKMDNPCLDNAEFVAQVYEEERFVVDLVTEP